ncbi:uncharacterized protein LOC135482717 [Lineus longissimus]|uniref:uncharacterized protein LOC135482717 n=1 Tax=Lineus longissimus TaxID=88925 RepID=UPI002B4C9DF3
MMKYFLAHLVVALFAYIRLTDASCSYTEATGLLSGYNIKSFSDISLDGCKHECDINPKCLSFQYRTRLCYLKKKAESPSRYLYKTYQTYRMFTKIPAGCTGSAITSRCQYNKQSGNCNGHDIKVHVHMSLVGCEIECSNRLDCYSFHYTPNIQYCYLKNYICTDAQLASKGAANTNQYAKAKNCPAYPGFTCQYSERAAAFCSGHVIQTLTKISIQACQAQCDNKVDCFGISYQTTGEICWIQNHACSEAQLVYKGNVIYNHYTKGACQKGSPVKCAFSRQTGNCLGYNLVAFSGTSLAACEMECTLRPACKSLLWFSKKCWLKSKQCTTKELKYTNQQAYNQFNKPASCNSGKKCSFTKQYAYCSRGTALKTISRATLSACETECSLLRRCVGFNYRTNTCWLQSTVCTAKNLLYKGNKYYKYYTKNDRTCSVPPEGHCKFKFEYGNCNGHDIKSYAAVTIDFCEKECSNLPDCISFHYNSARYCYLKNYICSEKQLAGKTNLATSQYIKPVGCFPRTEKICKYKKNHPAHCAGHVIQTISKVEVETCQTECNNKVDCLSFSYRHSDQICWLQNYACTYAQMIYKNLPDYTYYTKEDGCKKGTGVSCKYKLSFHDCQGHDILILSSVSLATCEMECEMRGSCKNFVYYNTGCRLKDYNCPTKEYWKGRTGNRYYKTFTKQGDCGQGAKCSFGLKYGNCPGHVIKTLTTTTLEDCFTECSAIRHCLGFQYRSKICWLQNYVCTDKQLQYSGQRLYKQYTKRDLDCSASPAKSCDFPKTYGNCNGHDIKSYAGVSLQFCKTACTNRIDCLAFYYNYARNCYLKNYICTDAQLAIKGNPLSANFVKPVSCTPSLGRVCKYSLRHADCAGHQIQYIPKISLKTCETQCSNNRDCEAFQYRIGNCWLKNYDCKENQLTHKNDGNYHLYTKKECSAATSDPCVFELATGDCVQGTIKTLTLVALATCKMECSQMANCKSFQYRVTTCWLKSIKCTDSQLRYKGNRYYNQYRKTGKCKIDRGPVCAFNLRYGLCNGRDIRSYSDISLSACLDQCSVQKLCLGVQYRTRTCWLKNYACTDAQLLYKGNRLYKQYDKKSLSCGTPPSDVCQFTTEKGFCSGHDIRVHYYLSLDACRTDCSRRIDCLSFFHNDRANHCYLKNYICKPNQLLYKTNALYNQNVKSTSCKIIPLSRDYPSQVCAYAATKKALCSGHVIQTISKIEPETCKTACNLKVDCVGFSYRWSDQVCWLQNYACKANQLVYKGNANYDNYIKEDCRRGSDVKCQFRRSYGTCGAYSYNWRIATLTNVSPETCMQECSQRGECKNFQMRQNVCWLSDYKCRPSEMTGVGNKLQNNFVKTGQCTKGTKCSYSIRYGNCPGRVIQTLTYVHLESCKAECSRMHNCHGFQFRSIYCWLQNYACDDSKLQYKGNRLYKQYTKNDRRCSVPPNKYCEFEFTQANCNGHNYRTYSAVSLEFCKTECTQQISCLSFQYTYTRICYLKNFDCAANQFSQRGVVGASNYRKPNSCGPRIGFICEYIHRNALCSGHVIQTLTKVDLDTCKTQCSNNRDCLGFQFKVGTCWIQNYDCTDAQMTQKGNQNYHNYRKKNTECPKAKAHVCQFNRVHGDCNKNMRNIQAFTAVSLRTCEMQCSKMAECKSLQYRDTRCWLKDHICTDAELSYKGNRYYNQFRKTASCKLPVPAVCKFTRRYGLCNGHDIKSFSGITLETCQAECSARTDCLSLQYRSNTCWLKNYVCPQATLLYKGNRLYKDYVKDNKNCGRPPTKGCSGFKTEQGTCSGHAIATYGGLSQAACEIECSYRVDCWSFLWYEPSSTCYLKNYICSTQQLIYKTNRYYTQTVKPNNCNMLGKVCDYSLEHNECPGHNIKTMAKVDLDTCRTQCNNDHDCLGFQYFTRICYIKNYDCTPTQLRNKGDLNYNQYYKKSCKRGLGPVCPFTRQFGQCRGHALATLPAVYLPTCKMACSRREDCLSAYFQRPNCYLKTYVCSTTELAYKGYRYMQQFTKSSTCAANEGKVCSYTERQGDCVGHDILKLTDVAFRTCKAQCATSKACRSFQYRSRNCWIKNYDCSKKQLKYTSLMQYRQFRKEMPCHKSPSKVCKFETVNGACNGHDIKRLTSVTIEACMAECTSRYNCQSFYYTWPYCYMKNYICKENQLASKQITNKQYNRATTCGRVKGNLCKFKTVAGYCNRYNFKTYHKLSLQACQIECSNRMDCVSIMYSKSAKQCLLKNNLCNQNEISLRSSTDYSVGVRTDECSTVPGHKCAYTKQIGNCAGHALITFTDIHMDTCLAECNARDDCYSAVYYLKNCYLKRYVCQPNQVSSKTNPNFWMFTKEKACIPPVPCKCRFQGDPHYYTFDHQKINFQGICKYTAAKSLDQKDKCAFKIETKQEYRGNHAVSYVRSVDLKMFGHVIRLQRGRIAFADGERISMPALNKFGHFDVTYSGGYMTATAKDCKISIRYNGDYMASATVDGTFRGKMNGICGNCNGKNDDWVTKEGKPTHDANEIGNSYQVADDSDMPSKNCKKPAPVIKCFEPLKTEVATNKYCGYIKDTNGPFGACVRSNKVGHMKQFHGCRYDVCALGGNVALAKEQSCAALAAFANKCTNRGYRVKKWRTTDFCPKKCGPGQRYSQNANSCPNTCANPVGNFICNKPPVEGCECKSGYVLSGTKCIPLSNCKAKPGPPCLKKIDIVFVVDSSAGVTDFKKMKAFMANLVASLGKIGPNHVQVGVVRYSTGATEVIRLNQYKNFATLQKAIVDIPHVPGATYTAKALYLTRVQALTSTHGRRGNGVKSMVIVLTDGKATDHKSVGKVSDDLRALTQRIIAVGIGHRINEQELELMANGKENVIRASSFSDLSSKIKSVLAKTCDCPIGFRVRNLKCEFAACPEGYEQVQDGTRMSCKKRKCPVGFIFTKGKCTYRACPGGYIALVVNNEVISCWPNQGKNCPHGYNEITLNGKKVCAKPHEPNCPAGSKVATVNGKRVCQVPTSGGCPRGSVEYFHDEKRVCYRPHPAACPEGTILAKIYGKKYCYKGRGCPIGYTRAAEERKCNFVKCPDHYVREKNRCKHIRAQSCPAGTTVGKIGFAHVCIKNAAYPCPKGSVEAIFGGKKVCYKYTSPFKCPPGHVQVYYRCVKDEHTCPKGTIVVSLKCHSICSKTGPKCPQGTVEGKAGGHSVCTRPEFVCPTGYQKEGMTCNRIVPRGHACATGTIRVTWAGHVYCIRGPPPGEKCPAGTKQETFMGRKICVRLPNEKKECPRGTYKIKYRGKVWCLRGPVPTPGNCPAGLARIVWNRKTFCFHIPPPNVACPEGKIKVKVGKNKVCAMKPPAAGKCAAGTILLKLGSKTFCVRGPAKKPTKPVKPVVEEKCTAGTIRINWMGRVFCIKKPNAEQKCPKGTKFISLGTIHLCARMPGKSGSCPRGRSAVIAAGRKYCLRVPGPKPEPPLTCPKGMMKITIGDTSFCAHAPGPAKPCPKGAERVKMRNRDTCIKPPVAGKCPKGNWRIVWNYRAYCLPLARPKPGSCPAGKIRLVWNGHTFCFNAAVPNQACPAGQKKEKIRRHEVCIETKVTGRTCAAGQTTIKWDGMVFCLTVPHGPGPNPSPIKTVCKHGTTERMFGNRAFCISPTEKDGNCPLKTVSFTFPGGKSGCIKAPGPVPQQMQAHCPKGMTKMVFGNDVFCVYQSPCKPGISEFSFFGIDVCAPAPVNGKCPSGFKIYSIAGQKMCVKDLLPAGIYCPDPSMEKMKVGLQVYCVLPAGRGGCSHGLNQLQYRGELICIMNPGKVPSIGCPAGSDGKVYGGIPFCVILFTGKCEEGTTEMEFDDEKYCVIDYAKDTHIKLGAIACPKGSEKEVYGGITFCFESFVENEECPKGSKEISVGGKDHCYVGAGPGGAGLIGCPKDTLTAEIHNKQYCLLYAFGGQCPADYIRSGFHGHLVCYEKSEFTCPPRYYLKNGLCVETKCPADYDEGYYNGEKMCFRKFSGKCDDGYIEGEYKGEKVCYQNYANFLIVCSTADDQHFFKFGETYEDKEQCATYKCMLSGPKTIAQTCPGSNGTCHKPGTVFKCQYGDKCSCEIEENYVQYTLTE